MTTSLADGRIRRLLVIDDSPQAIAWFRGVCVPAMEVREVESLALATDLVASFRPDAIVVATSMFEHDQASNVFDRVQIELAIASLRSSYRSLPVLIRCDGDQMSTRIVVAAGGLEGVEIISLAMGDARLQKLFAVLERQRQRWRQPRMQVSPLPSGAERGLPLLGSCPAMLDVLRTIGSVTRVHHPVLIVGEVGTGKRSVAKCIHEASDAPREPFQLLDAVAIEPSVMEALLFATNDPRSIRLNDTLAGTVVIAHAERLTPALQAMLAAVFRSNTVNVRWILTTTNPTLLWPDLRYLVQGDLISLPPLRARGDDLGILISHFIDETLGPCIGEASAQRYVTDEAMKLLFQHAWPGNLSELRSVIAGELRGGRRMVEDSDALRKKLGQSQFESQASDVMRGSHSLAESHLVATAFDPSTSAVEKTQMVGTPNYDGSLIPQLRSETFWRSEAAGYAAALPPAPEMGMLLGEATEAVEAGLIAAVLEHTRGNIAQSARLLGITRVSLRRKIQTFQLIVPGRPTLPT
ncbi:MAG TPA: hypothetical protein DDZ51_18470 [Planctomycetaceae bacterium]|nr:hypothetical protein [Planctomycetaceae bacterium]